MQVASMKPQYLIEPMPKEIVEHETQVQTEIAKRQTMPKTRTYH